MLEDLEVESTSLKEELASVESELRDLEAAETRYSKKGGNK